PSVVFLFPGQGVQRIGMGRRLYENEPAYRDAIDLCANALRDPLGVDLRDILYGADEAHAARLDETALAQPALFATEYALAQLWIGWGVRPDAMLGHSVGEWVAATLGGVIDLDAALALVARRGRLMQAQPRGAMVAVALSALALRERLEDGLDVAVVDGPSRC